MPFGNINSTILETDFGAPKADDPEVGELEIHVLPELILLGYKTRTNEMTGQPERQPVYTIAEHVAFNKPGIGIPDNIHVSEVDLVQDLLARPSGETLSPTQKSLLEISGSRNDNVLILAKPIPQQSLIALQKHLLDAGKIDEPAELIQGVGIISRFAHHFGSQHNADELYDPGRSSITGNIGAEWSRGNELFEPVLRTDLGTIEMMVEREFRYLQIPNIVRQRLFMGTPFFGQDEAHIYTVQDHIAMILNPDKISAADTINLRVHSECATGDMWGSHHCDCGSQHHDALCTFAKEGGVHVYHREEGRGARLLTAKMMMYEATRTHSDVPGAELDTYAAMNSIGYPNEARSFTVISHMLKERVSRRFDNKPYTAFTHNRYKIQKLTADGVQIKGMRSLNSRVTKRNRIYLGTKAKKGGHALDHLDV